MGWNRHVEDNGLKHFLEQLVVHGHLGDPADGIAKLVIDKGEEVLSAKQRFVFERHVLEANSLEECKRCGESAIPWSEMYEARASGYCSWCAHQMAKDD